jgi:hypothetical protein
MAFSITLSSGATIIVPDSTVDISVANNPAGISTTGVVALIGEADEGPSWSQDAANQIKPANQSFSPTEINKVIAKFGSGRLVDAFRGISAPASQGLTGAPNRVILIKSNDSASAALTLSHGMLIAKRGGEQGNSVTAAISSSSPEAAPSTGSFSYVPSTSASAVAFRVNGGAKQTLAIPANTLPSSLASTLTSMSGVNVTGGINRAIIASLTGQTLELQVVAGQSVKIKLAAGQIFSAAPKAGDAIRIPAGSVLQGTASANVGWYLVTSVSDTIADASINAKKITAGAPIAVSATSIISPNAEMIDYSYMKIDNSTGSDRNVLSALVGQNISAAAASSSLTLALSVGQVFAGAPAVGDLLMIPAGSVVAGVGDANVGYYQVTVVSNDVMNASIKASRLSNGSPASVSSVAISATSDISVMDPQIAGIGKSLEIYDNAGAANINTIFKSLGADAAANFLQSLLASSVELKKTISLKKDSSGLQESFVVGGDIVMTLGYNGTSATSTIGLVGGVLKLQTSVVGGAGTNLDIDLSKIASIAQLVAKINLNAGYKAAAASVAASQVSPSVLDQASFSIASDLANMPARIKNDLYALTKSDKGLKGSTMIVYAPIATAGLPEDKSIAYLSGGSKGGSSGLQLSKAIDALQAVRCNFVVPLISKDASADILSGDTDPSSTYMVDAINAAVKTHVLSMSTAKIKRHRVCIVSKNDTFANVKASAQNMASFRVAHVFQDAKDFSASTGNIVQFQSWMSAVKAAGMQAAASYKGIFGPRRLVNISGAIQAAADFDDQSIGDLEDALLAGLMPLQRQETGGFSWVSDQMTYSIDNNFVYNSLQAVYIADVMAITLADSLKKAFIGESVADVSVGLVETFVNAKLNEFLNNKFTVGTTSYPNGVKSISISIDGSVLFVEVCVIEASTIKFIPVSLQIDGIKSSTAA